MNKLGRNKFRRAKIPGRDLGELRLAKIPGRNLAVRKYRFMEGLGKCNLSPCAYWAGNCDGDTFVRSAPFVLSPNPPPYQRPTSRATDRSPNPQPPSPSN